MERDGARGCVGRRGSSGLAFRRTPGSAPEQELRRVARNRRRVFIEISNGLKVPAGSPVLDLSVALLYLWTERPLFRQVARSGVTPGAAMPLVRSRFGKAPHVERRPRLIPVRRRSLVEPGMPGCYGGHGPLQGLAAPPFGRWEDPLAAIDGVPVRGGTAALRRVQDVHRNQQPLGWSLAPESRMAGPICGIR